MMTLRQGVLGVWRPVQISPVHSFGWAGGWRRKIMFVVCTAQLGSRLSFLREMPWGYVLYLL